MGFNRSNSLNVVTVVLLLIGWVFLGIGELVGLVLLLSSNAWTRRDKIIGMLLMLELPLILILLLTAAGSGSCTYHANCSSSNASAVNVIPIAFVFATFVAAIIGALYLVKQGGKES